MTQTAGPSQPSPEARQLLFWESLKSKKQEHSSMSWRGANEYALDQKEAGKEGGQEAGKEAGKEKLAPSPPDAAKSPRPSPRGRSADATRPGSAKLGDKPGAGKGFAAAYNTPAKSPRAASARAPRY